LVSLADSGRHGSHPDEVVAMPAEIPPRSAA
jgi:hypothetical protein